jgi:hypothetical protein
MNKDSSFQTLTDIHFEKLTRTEITKKRIFNRNKSHQLTYHKFKYENEQLANDICL